MNNETKNKNIYVGQKLDVVLAVSIAVLGALLVILTIFVTIKIRREKVNCTLYSL